MPVDSLMLSTELVAQVCMKSIVHKVWSTIYLSVVFASERGMPLKSLT